MDERVLEKLKVLAESAKYDVSCASSGTSRKNKSGGIGSAAGWGICHSFAEDGRCISLLKIMLTNYCMFIAPTVSIAAATIFPVPHCR